MGKEIRFHSCIFNTGEWAPGGRVDSPTKGREAGMPTCLLVLVVDALFTCTMQACSQGLLRGYQTPSYPDGIPFMQYADDNAFFYRRLGRGSKESAHFVRSIC